MEEEGLKQDLRQRGRETEAGQACWRSATCLFQTARLEKPQARLGRRSPGKEDDPGKETLAPNPPLCIATKLADSWGFPEAHSPGPHLSLINGSLPELCNPGVTSPPLSSITHDPRFTEELPGFRKLMSNCKAGLLGPPHLRPHA